MEPLIPVGCIRRHHAGFTLIEVLVVLSIVALMAGGLTLSLGAARAQEAEHAVERLRRMLEAAAERAEVTGQPIAVDFLVDGYRFSAYETDGNWHPLHDAPHFAERILPAEVRPFGLRIERRELSADRRLVFSGTAPNFELRLDTPGGPVSLVGRATGVVERVVQGAR